MRDRVLDTVAQIMASQGKLAHSMEVLVTGKHPLLQSTYSGLRGLAADPEANIAITSILIYIHSQDSLTYSVGRSLRVQECWTAVNL